LRKNIGLICVLAFFLVLFGALNVYAEWINCSGPFPGNCDQGGCMNPDRAEVCVLYGCDGGPAICVKKP